MNKKTREIKKASKLLEQYNDKTNAVIEVYAIYENGEQKKIIKDFLPNVDSLWRAINMYIRGKSNIAALNIYVKDTDTKKNIDFIPIVLEQNENLQGETNNNQKMLPPGFPPGELSGMGLGDIGAIVNFEINKLRTTEKIEKLEAENKELKQEISEKDNIIDEYQKTFKRSEQLAFYVRAAKEMGMPAIASKLEGLMGLSDNDEESNNPQNGDSDRTGIVEDTKLESMRAQIVQYLQTIDNERDMARIYTILSTTQEKPELLPMLVSLLENEINNNKNNTENV